jgi:hypothetical protein
MSCETPADNDDAVIEIPDTLDLTFYELATYIEPPPANNPRRIKLTWAVSRYRFGDNVDGIRVRIEASDPVNMPDTVFAYLMAPPRPGQETGTGAFDHVCSPTDLEEYPEAEPQPNSRPAWFRLNYVDVILRSRAEVKAFIRDVADDVQQLKKTLDIMDTLLPGGSVWIGPAPTP